MKKSNGKQCGNCVHYCAYYEEGYWFFYETQRGLCENRREIVNQCDSCELWAKKPPITVTTEEIDKLSDELSRFRDSLLKSEKQSDV